jgi:hypothetical protein
MVGVRDAEKVVEQWKSLIQLLVEAERPPGDREPLFWSSSFHELGDLPPVGRDLLD